MIGYFCLIQYNIWCDLFGVVHSHSYIYVMVNKKEKLAKEINDLYQKRQAYEERLQAINIKLERKLAKLEKICN